jgi:cell division protein FtsB
MEKLIQSGREKVHHWRGRIVTAAIAATLFVGAYYVVFSANGLMAYEQKRRESRDLDRQIKSLQQQNGAMEQEIKALKNDPKTIEKEAREHLRYAKPGEVVYTLPTAPAPAPSPGKK